MATKKPTSPWVTLNRPFGSHKPVPDSGPKPAMPSKPVAPSKAGTKGK